MVIGNGKSNCRSLIIRNDWAIVNYGTFIARGVQTSLICTPLLLRRRLTHGTLRSMDTFSFPLCIDAMDREIVVEGKRLRDVLRYRFPFFLIITIVE